MKHNLLANLPPKLSAEQVDVLVNQRGVRIQRIVSTGHCSPAGFWYDQSQDEWVVLLRGKARLVFENAEAAVDLVPGDHLLIPAHRRHRVDWTSRDEPCVWLAVFLAEEGEANHA